VTMFRRFFKKFIGVSVPFPILIIFHDSIHLHHESVNLWKKNQIFIKSSKNIKLRFEDQSDVGIR